MNKIEYRKAFVEDEEDVSRFLDVISRRKKSIFNTVFFITLSSILLAYLITPVYKARSTLLIEPQQMKLLSIEEDLYGVSGTDDKYYLSQLELLKSRKLVAQVVRDLRLGSYSEFTEQNLLASIKQWLSPQMSDHGFELVVQAVQKRLTAKLIKDTQLISVEFESESPTLAAKVANALANAYINDQLGSRVNTARQAVDWIEPRLKELKQKLLGSEQALQAYMQENQLVDVEGVRTLTAQELDELTSQMIMARSEYTELSKRYGSKHPRIIAAKSELRVAEAALQRAKSKIQNIGLKEVNLRELKREVNSNRLLYDTFMSRLKEASQAIDIDSVMARISDPAVAPVEPFKPKKVLIVMMAFFASLLLAVLLAFIYEALDKTLGRARDVEKKLAQPILGLLPQINGGKGSDSQSRAFAMLDSNQTQFSEAMHSICAELMLASQKMQHKRILITSSVADEGKSLVAINMATEMARMEKVLLVEADLRRPSISQAMGITDQQPGLSNIVAHSADSRRCIHHVSQSGIDVLPCGHLPPNPTAVLLSERFEKLLDILAGHYDRIIIDSPPVHMVSDTMVLSSLAQAVVYVVEADSTHEDVARNGVNRLIQHNAPIVGVILNKIDAKRFAKYGYEFGGYYGDAPEKG